MKIKLSELFRVKARNVVEKNVSNLEKLQIEIDKYEKLNNEVKNNYYECKGSLEYYTKLKGNIESKVNQLTQNAKKVLDDDSMLSRFKKEIDKLNRQKEITINQIETTTKISDKLYKQKNLVSSRLSDLKGRYDELKMKEQFSNSVNSFVKKGILDIGENIDTSDIEKDIEINYNTKNIQLDDIIEDSNLSLEKIDDSDDLDEFKRQLKGE